MPEATPTPGASSGLPTPAAANQPPMGVSSATGPTPNKGFEAAAMQGVGVVLNKLAEILPTVGPASEIGKAVSKAIDALVKVVQPGSVSPAAQRNTLDKMQMQNAQQQQTMKSMQPGAGGGQPPQPGAGQQPPSMAA